MRKIYPEGTRMKQLIFKTQNEIDKDAIFKHYKHGSISLSNLDVDSLEGFPVLKLSPSAQRGIDNSDGVLASGPMINVSYNPRLTSLKGLQSQIFNLNAKKCGFTDLTSFPQIVEGYIDISGNNITHLKGIGKEYLRHVFGNINLVNCPIESNILGLMRVAGLTNVKLGMDNNEHPLAVPLDNVMNIMNKHLRKKSRDLIKCKEELMAAGYKEYARL